MAKKKSTNDSIPEEVKRLLAEPCEKEELITFLLNLKEGDRRTVSPFVCKVYRKKVKDSAQDESGLFLAELAVFCVCEFTEVKRIPIWRINDEDAFFDVVRKRKPSWSQKLIESLIGVNWRKVRELIKTKIVKRPETENYYLRMITGLVPDRWSSSEASSIYKELCNDPELLRHEVWKLFEIEGDSVSSLTKNDRTYSDRWNEAFVKLSNEKKLNRNRLLKSSMNALQAGFSSYHCSWYLNFFDELKPTDDELRSFRKTIVELLDSTAENVAIWAFEKTKYLVDSGFVRVNADLVNSLQPILLAQKKKAVKDCLKYLVQIASEKQELLGEVCNVVANGLGHEKTEIQTEVFKTITKLVPSDFPGINEIVSNYQTVMSSSLTKQYKAWTNECDSNSETDSTPVKPDSKNVQQNQTATKSNFDKVFAKYPGSQLTALRVDRLLSVKDIDQGQLGRSAVPAIDLDEADFSVLDPEKELKPIVDLDELIEVCSRFIENESLIEDGERVLAGLARLQPPDKSDVEEFAEFQTKLGPLLKRTQQFLKKGKIPFGYDVLSADVCALIYIWLNGSQVTKAVGTDEDGVKQNQILGVSDVPLRIWKEPEDWIPFLSSRNLEFSKKILTGPFQLLSEPTHLGGWIDPAELVRRLNSLKEQPGELDVMLAMLRLAPQGRKEALDQLDCPLRGELINAVKYALGGKVPIEKNEDLWACAARSRNPKKDDELVIQAFSDQKKGIGYSGKVVIDCSDPLAGSPGSTSKNTKFEIPPDQEPASLPIFYDQLNEPIRCYFLGAGSAIASVRWMAQKWPSDRKTFVAVGIHCLYGNIDWWEANWHYRCFMEPFLNEDEPLDQISLFLILVGLGCKEPGDYGFAVDVFIQAINDGRIGTDNLAGVFCSQLPKNEISFTRGPFKTI